VEDATRLERRAAADRVAERHLVAALIEQLARDAQALLRIDLALVGAAPERRDVPAHPEPARDRGGDHVAEPGERVAHRLVHVLEVVGLARADEDRDLLDTRRERALEPARVRAERAEGDTF